MLERIQRFFSHARYITLGMMDGGLATLSVVTAAYFTSIESTTALIRVLLGVAIGISASNFSGAYLAEQAEINKDRRKIERSMGLKSGHLQHTLLGYQLRKKVIIRALTNSGAAFLGVLISILPLLFFPYYSGIFGSILVSMGLLFLLGVYLGHYNKTDLFLNGVKVLLIALLVLVVNVLISYV
ncbi:hypothetical protein KJ765_03690 [Candidatus Micrarchaeota archaeon]|nr:hypothetical protein [Candidatus Micrarchaeota archaeon]